MRAVGNTRPIVSAAVPPRNFRSLNLPRTPSNGPVVGRGWSSGHIDTQMADPLKISRLMTRITDSDSEADPADPENVAAVKSLRKKLRAFPIGKMRIRHQD